MYSEDRVIYKITSEEISKRMKEDLKNPPNRVEGSFAADNIQAVAKEMAKYYDYVDYLQDMHYAETAEGDFLDKKAMEVGVFRKKPTKAVGYVTFEGAPDTFVPAGIRVSSDSKDYVTMKMGYIGEDGKLTLPVEAVEAGESYSIPPGSIYDWDKSVGGVRKVYNDNPIEGGTDLEDDDHLRERTLLKMRYPGTSGNQYHYMHWAMEVDGVGRVKVFPLWKGPGTVKVSILDSNQRVANDYLVEKVRKHIEEGGDRQGEGLAPIGANLTVSTAKAVPITVKARVLLEPGSKYDKKRLADRLKEDLQAYIDREIAYKSPRLTAAKVIDILYSVEGVMDIMELTLNDRSDSLIFAEEEIGRVGEVILS